jgi:hypothetical protein
LSNGIACWGRGKEGVTLAECTNVNCINKFKAKQDRKQVVIDNSTSQVQQHLKMKTINDYSMKDVSSDSDSENEYNGCLKMISISRKKKS